MEMLGINGTVTDDNDSLEELPPRPITSQLLLLPQEMREKIYTFLEPHDFLVVRLVCRKFYWEAKIFGWFNVFFDSYNSRTIDEIPFSNIRFLSINNDHEELPWGTSPDDTADTMNLRNVSFKTLKILSTVKNIQQVTMSSNIFIRPLPPLLWSQLTYLRILFHVSEDQTESFMLDNLDTLFLNEFLSMTTLVISFGNTFLPNLQSQYTLRIAKFISTHWKCLKQLSITMEARRCVERDFITPLYFKTPLMDEDMKNFKKIQLTSLEFNFTEMNCPKCFMFRKLIINQRGLKALHVHISSADKLPTMFFCNMDSFDQFLFLEVLSIRLWGLSDFYPLDFRYLGTAKKLNYLEVGRYPRIRTEAHTPDLLHIDKIPENIGLLSLSGFLIHSGDVPVLFEKLQHLKELTLLDCGSIGQEMGVTTDHIICLATHPTIISALIDFNPVDLDLFKSQETIKQCIRKHLNFPYRWKHLYNVGLDVYKYHRFEFTRIPPEWISSNSSSIDDENFNINSLHRIYYSNDHVDVFGKYYYYESPGY